MELISEGIFGKYSKMKIFFFKGQILMPFSGLAPSKLKFFSKKLRVGFVYIEESFDSIFNMGYGGPTGPHALCVGKITHAFKG